MKLDGQNSVISKWLLSELLFSNRWSWGTKTLGMRLAQSVKFYRLNNCICDTVRNCLPPPAPPSSPVAFPGLRIYSTCSSTLGLLILRNTHQLPCSLAKRSFIKLAVVLKHYLLLISILLVMIYDKNAVHKPKPS